MSTLRVTLATLYAAIISLFGRWLPPKHQQRPQRLLDRDRWLLARQLDPKVTTAVHESGHAVVAWACSAVTEIHTASIEDSGDRDGHVRYEARGNREHVYWCQLTIALAGMAAEAVVFGRVEPGKRGDLASAMESAKRITEEPPWITEGFPVPPFERLYVEQPSPETMRALSAGYSMARKIVTTHPEFYRLVSALMAHETLTSRQIDDVLGHRAPIRLLGCVAATFVVPRARITGDRLQ
jgi:hypothetical protein